MKSKKDKVINVGTIERTWEYSPEPRLEGLLQASKYLKWKNVKSFEELNNKGGINHERN